MQRLHLDQQQNHAVRECTGPTDCSENYVKIIQSLDAGYQPVLLLAYLNTIAQAVTFP